MEWCTATEREEEKSTELDQGPTHALFEFALANLTACLDYLQLIRLKEAVGQSITWEEVDAVILRNETIRAQLEALRGRKN
jgi:hypothetical protein